MTTLIDRNQCSALVITCSDFRFKSAEGAFVQAAQLADDYDLIARPGSIRSLVEPRSAGARETMLEEIQLLWTVHQFSRVLMVNHVSCRAYDGIVTADNAVEIHKKHLRMAIGVVEAMLKDVHAQSYLIEHVEDDFVVKEVPADGAD